MFQWLIPDFDFQKYYFFSTLDEPKTRQMNSAIFLGAKNLNE